MAKPAIRELVTQSSIAATSVWKAAASSPSKICHCILLSNFYISTKFLPSFLKLSQIFLVFENFTKNFRILASVLQCFSTVFQNFFTIDNLKLHYNVSKVPSGKQEISLKFSHNLTNCISKCVSNFLKIFTNLTPGCVPI